MKKLIILFVLVAAWHGAAAQPVAREDAPALMEQCQQERARQIAPLRAQAVEECVSRRLRSREECERRNETFGERSRAGAPTGMFWDLPTCKRALDAEQYFRRNPRAQVYDGA